MMKILSMIIIIVILFIVIGCTPDPKPSPTIAEYTPIPDYILEQKSFDTHVDVASPMRTEDEAEKEYEIEITID